MKFKNLKIAFLSTTIIIIISYLAFIFIRYTINHFSRPKRSLTVLAWMDSFSPEVIEQFEEETGIKINISYYTSNEELVAKIFLTKGKNIDVIIPSDYALHILLKDKLLAPIDKRRIKKYSKLYPFLLFNEYSSQHFVYAVPFEWGIYGLAYHEKYSSLFQNTQNCATAFFNGKLDSQKFSVGMINDILAACNVTWNYYVYMFKNIVPDQKAVFSILYEMLKKQYKHVTTYIDSNVIPLLKNQSIDIAYLQSDEYIRYLTQNNNIPEIQFVLPPGNVLKTVEYIAFSRTIKNKIEAYEFINYLLSKKISLKTMKSLGYFPVRSDIVAHDSVNKSVKNILDTVIARGKQLKSVDIILHEKDQMMLWMKLKS